VGARVTGLDLSPAVIRTARAAHPHLPFVVGDMFAPPFREERFAGVVAFYAACHAAPDDLPRLFAAWRRVLAPGGWLLLSFHLGEERVHLDDWFGQRVDLDFWFFPRARVEAALAAAGLPLEGYVERDPDPKVEHPSRRAYLIARRG
jgi:SAM-dependent methyltransferase